MSRNPASILYDASGNPVGVVLDGGVYRLQSESKLVAGAAEIGSVAQGTKGAGSNAWPVGLYDVAGDPVTITLDGSVRRVEIQGKVSVVGALPPPGTTGTFINADTPLVVGSHDTTWTIPSGETFHLQSAIAGNEDPTKGAVVEVLFDDGSEHLIERVYMNGRTISISYGDVDEARDGTPLLGNGTNSIIVRRAKFSGTNIAIDAVVLGYSE